MRGRNKIHWLTWKQDSEGTEARWKCGVNFSPALSNMMALPQNNIQQVFQRLHALLQEEYSGEDLQIIACPSLEQVQRQQAPNMDLIITQQQPFAAKSNFCRL